MISYLFIFFWFLHILQRTFYSLYIWQLKEYRIDRFSEEIGRDRRAIFSRSSFFALMLLLIAFLLRFSFLSIHLIMLSYLLLGFRSCYLLIREKWIFPKFTKKMLVLSGVMLFLLIFSTFIFKKFILFIPIFEILFPLYIFFCVQFFQIPVFFIKTWIKEKARKKREKFKDLIVIGVTGSFGKSSVKEFLYEILSKKYNILKTEANINTEIGIANTVIQKLNKGHQIFICEIGAYKRGEIKRVCEVIKPKIGILTGINQQHLALFGSQENIVSGKFELIDSLPKGGTAILNWDNSLIRKRTKKYEDADIKIIKYSVLGKQDVWTDSVKVKKKRVSFKAFSKDGNYADFEIDVLGAQNISNVLSAVCCAKEFGVDMKDAADVLRRTEYVGVMNIKKGVSNTDIIDFTYSTNPSGVISHLNHLKLWNGRKIIVMPCLIELGRASEEVHKRIGEKAGEVCDLVIVTKKRCFSYIKKGALQRGMDEDNVLFIEEPKEILKKIESVANPGDVILLEGRISKDIINLLVSK